MCIRDSSTIVNLARVRSLRPHLNGECFLKLQSGQEVKLSRSFRDKVEMLLDRSGSAPHTHRAEGARAVPAGRGRRGTCG